MSDPYDWLNEPVYTPSKQDDEIVDKIAGTGEPEFGELWMGCYWKYCDSIIQLGDSAAKNWYVYPNYHRPDTNLMFCSDACLRSWTAQATEFEKTGKQPAPAMPVLPDINRKKPFKIGDIL